jgi:glycosyltransferase involved in cell wall biosynthesis
VEAGYYGIPAIAPHRFGIPEMIKDGETGYLVASNSVDEYVEKLSTILNQQESLRKMKEQVYQQMCNSFSWVKVGERMALIIKKTFNQ